MKVNWILFIHEYWKKGAAGLLFFPVSPGHDLDKSPVYQRAEILKETTIQTIATI